jgi:hypothetical protein
MLLLYPPFLASVLAPLCYLSPQLAFLLWRELTLFLLVFSIYFGLKWLRAAPFAPVFVLAVAAGISFFPFLETMSTGNVGVLLFFLWTLGIFFVDRKLPVWSALCFAIGTMIKLTPAVVVPLFC